jgi:hypothetical protein
MSEILNIHILNYLFGLLKSLQQLEGRIAETTATESQEDAEHMETAEMQVGCLSRDK